MLCLIFTSACILCRPDAPTVQQVQSGRIHSKQPSALKRNAPDNLAHAGRFLSLLYAGKIRSQDAWRYGVHLLNEPDFATASYGGLVLEHLAREDPSCQPVALSIIEDRIFRADQTSKFEYLKQYLSVISASFRNPEGSRVGRWKPASGAYAAIAARLMKGGKLVSADKLIVQQMLASVSIPAYLSASDILIRSSRISAQNREWALRQVEGKVAGTDKVMRPYWIVVSEIISDQYRPGA